MPKLHNLYGEPAHRHLSEQLAARLTELRRELGDQYVYQPAVVVREEGCEEKWTLTIPWAPERPCT